MSRTERDSIGQRELPKGTLFGINTLRGSENFDISNRKIGHEPALIHALAQIKKAAAQANGQLGLLGDAQTKAIAAACDEVIGGKHYESFIIDCFEGSGGTSINMNANEVIANRALQLMGFAAGDYHQLSPNDHVNMGQSTNDVVPSALKLAFTEKAGALLISIKDLAQAFDKKAKETADVLKVGRTCMQAAQPMTIGQELSGYASVLHRAVAKLKLALSDLAVLPLGSTAIGTGMGAHPDYQRLVFENLSASLSHSVSPAINMFDAMQNADSFSRLSAELRVVAEAIAKISLDLVILSSDAAAGLGEIKLPAIQAGSSIMPGKINPVMPMMMQQAAFVVIGNDTSVSLAAMSGQLEINHFEPVIALRIFESMEILTRGCTIFSQKCVAGIQADREQSLANLMASPAISTAFVAEHGYVKVSEFVKAADKSRRSFADYMLAQGHVDEEGILQTLNAATGAGGT